MKFLLHLLPKATGLLRTSREHFTRGRQERGALAKTRLWQERTGSWTRGLLGPTFFRDSLLPRLRRPCQGEPGWERKERMPPWPSPSRRSWPSLQGSSEAKHREGGGLGRLEALREEAQAFGEGLTLKVNIDPGKLPLAQTGAQLESEPPTDHPLHR